MDEREYRVLRDLNESINSSARTNKALTEMVELSMKQQQNLRNEVQALTQQIGSLRKQLENGNTAETTNNQTTAKTTNNQTTAETTNNQTTAKTTNNENKHDKKSDSLLFLFQIGMIKLKELPDNLFGKEYLSNVIELSKDHLMSQFEEKTQDVKDDQDIMEDLEIAVKAKIQETTDYINQRAQEYKKTKKDVIENKKKEISEFEV